METIVENIRLHLLKCPIWVLSLIIISMSVIIAMVLVGSDMLFSGENHTILKVSGVIGLLYFASLAFSNKIRSWPDFSIISIVCAFMAILVAVFNFYNLLDILDDVNTSYIVAIYSCLAYLALLASINTAKKLSKMV